MADDDDIAVAAAVRFCTKLKTKRQKEAVAVDRIKGDMKESTGYTMLCASDRNS